jgi:SAM-dependent methyltransferase
MNIDYVVFRQRSDRSSYIAQRFRRYFSDSILDVGCDKAVLRAILKNIKYTGVDVGGTPDIRLDLEKIDKLPFADDEFTATVCSDVLEHLDNLHFMFGELVRVTKRYLIVSLPNNWTNARKPIERGHGSIAHYGLPPTKPVDRHKWFFSYSEAYGFLESQQSLYPISIIDAAVNEKPRFVLSRILRRVRYPLLDHYLNRYAHTVWVVYEKNSNAK